MRSRRHQLKGCRKALPRNSLQAFDVSGATSATLGCVESKDRDQYLATDNPPRAELADLVLGDRLTTAEDHGYSR